MYRRKKGIKGVETWFHRSCTVSDVLWQATIGRSYTQFTLDIQPDAARCHMESNEQTSLGHLKSNIHRCVRLVAAQSFACRRVAASLSKLPLVTDLRDEHVKSCSKPPMMTQRKSNESQRHARAWPRCRSSRCMKNVSPNIDLRSASIPRANPAHHAAEEEGRPAQGEQAGD